MADQIEDEAAPTGGSYGLARCWHGGCAGIVERRSVGIVLARARLTKRHNTDDKINNNDAKEANIRQH